MIRCLPKILYLIAIIVCTLNANGEPKRIYHDNITTCTDTTIILDTDNHAYICGKAIEIRASLPDAKDCQGLSSQQYGVIWGANADTTDYYSATITPGNDAYGHIIDARYMLLQVRHHAPDSTSTIYAAKLTKDVGLENKENSLAVEADTSEVRIYVGYKQLQLLNTIPLIGTQAGALGIVTSGKADFSLLVTEQTIDPIASLSTNWTLENLKERFASTSRTGHEGFWQYLDRDMDTHYCRTGGTYTIALVSDLAGGYDIVYISGAEINQSKWQTGMKKGHLTPTIFTNHYNLTWVDATFDTLDNDCHATVEQGSILTLSFPLMKASMRLSIVQGR